MLNLLNQRKRVRRVLVLGLDCASPHLIFDPFKAKLPTFSRLAETGTWGELTSIPLHRTYLGEHDQQPRPRRAGRLRIL